MGEGTSHAEKMRGEFGVVWVLYPGKEIPGA